MDNLLKNKLEKIIDITKKNGAQDCDAILSKGKSFSLSAQNAEIDKYKISGSQVIGIRAIKYSKVGISYTESLDDDALELAAKAAVENAINSEVSEGASISISEGEHIFESEFKTDNISTDEKIDFCLKLESEVKNTDSRVTTVPYNGFSESTGESYYLNHHGVFGYSSEYYMSCYTSALLAEGGNNSMHYHSQLGRKLKDLSIDECVKESLEHANNWLTAKALPTKNYDVIFTLDSFADFFSNFSNIYSGRGAMENTNPFAERIGKKIAHENFTLSDIPQYENAFFKSHFDSEGVKHRDLVLVKDGVLESFYHNSITAKHFNIETTAHASRGAKSNLGVGGTTKVISAGNMAENDILSGEYFEVHSMQGLGSGSNAISGDFSFAASGYLCRDGKRVQPVKGVTVSGNFFKLLENVNLFGDTIKGTSDRSFFAPIIRFESVSVAG